MRLTYFGRLGDVARCGEEEFELPDHVRDTAALRAWLDQRFDTRDFGSDTVRIAIDDRMAVATQPLGDATRIAFLPPVGGG